MKTLLGIVVLAATLALHFVLMTAQESFVHSHGFSHAAAQVETVARFP